MTNATILASVSNRHNAIPQYLELRVPLARTDGRADNSAIRTIAVLSAAGFTILRTEVHELPHAYGVERHVRACVMTPRCRGNKWVSALNRVMRTLRIDAVEIDEDESYFSAMLRKLDAPRPALSSNRIASGLR